MARFRSTWSTRHTSHSMAKKWEKRGCTTMSSPFFLPLAPAAVPLPLLRLAISMPSSVASGTPVMAHVQWRCLLFLGGTAMSMTSAHASERAARSTSAAVLESLSPSTRAWILDTTPCTLTTDSTTLQAHCSPAFRDCVRNFLYMPCSKNMIRPSSNFIILRQTS